MNEISIITTLKILFQKIWVLVICGIIGLTAGYSYVNFVVQPIYKASAIVCAASGTFLSDNDNLTSQGANNITTAELSVTLALMDSFIGILDNSTEIYNDTLLQTGLDSKYKVQQLMGMVDVSLLKEDTFLIKIDVMSYNPQDCVALVNKFVELTPNCIMQKVGRTNVKILTNADVHGAKQVSPNVVLTMCMTLLLGVVVGAAIVIISYNSDKTIKGEDDYLDHFNLPLLGTIPDFGNYQTKRKGV